MTLADTIATALLLGTVLPLVLFGAVEGRARYVNERLRIDEQNSANAQRAAEAVESELSAAMGTASFVANVLSVSTGGGPLPAAEELQRQLPQWTRGTGLMGLGYVTDPRGEPLAFFGSSEDTGAERRIRAEGLDLRTHPPRSARPFVRASLRAGEALPDVVAVAPVMTGDHVHGFVAIRVGVRLSTPSCVHASRKANARC